MSITSTTQERIRKKELEDAQYEVKDAIRSAISNNTHGGVFAGILVDRINELIDIKIRHALETYHETSDED